MFSIFTIFVPTYQKSNVEAFRYYLSLKSGQFCIIHTQLSVYQKNKNRNNSQKRQNRNKVCILGYSPLFTFHLVSPFALGCTQSISRHNFLTTYLSPEEYIMQHMDELLQPKEKGTNLRFWFTSSSRILFLTKVTISIKPQAYGKTNMPT